MKESSRILVIRLSSLGDIIHTLPAYYSLRASFPGARIDWLVERRLAFMLSVVEGIDNVLPIDTRALRAAPLQAQSRRLFLDPVRAMRRSRYDLAIDFQGLMKTALLGFASRAALRIGFPAGLARERPAHWFYTKTIAPPVAPLHVTRLNLLLTQAAGASEANAPVKIRALSADTATIESRLSREGLTQFFVLNPGGGWPTKRWPPSKYGTLADRIQSETGLRAVITTGPGEDSLHTEIARACPGRPPVLFDVPFLQLIPLYRRAKLVIAGDTGPLHLACALGVPTVGIMGPTSPERNGPWTGRDEVVVHRLACSFCNGRTCPTQNECMDIAVEEVFAAAVRCLARNSVGDESR